MKNTVKIYDRAFAELGITGNFTELEYTRHFREAGEAVLRLPFGAGTDMLMPDGYISVPEGDMYRIVSVERDLERGETVVRCTGLLALLGGTVIPEEYTLTGGAASLMYVLVRRSLANLPLKLSLGDAVNSTSVRFSSGRSYLYDDLVSLCFLGELGMKLEAVDGSLRFSACLPRDRTAGSDSPVLVSRRMGTFDSEGMLWDLSGYRNVAVVSGAEKESGGRYTVTVRSDSIHIDGTFPDGDYFDRQTLVNFTSPQRPYMAENAEGLLELDEEAYLAAMTAAGAAVLGRCRPKLYLFGGMEADIAEVSPGDKVTVRDGELDLWGTATAESVTTYYTSGGRRVSVSFLADISP